MFIDPACNLWAVNGQGPAYSLEVCDPVEAPAYPVPVNGVSVSVSNFVFPSWFDPQGTAPFDKKGQVTAAFTIAPGGYANYMNGGHFTPAAGGYATYVQGGQVKQQWGTNYPGWRKTMKSPGTAGPMARSQRILGLWHT